MKPPRFSYHDPESLPEALALLSSLDNVRPLAGGQSLMPMLNMRFVFPDHVVDLNRVRELAGIVLDGDALSVGAMTRQRDLEFSDLVAKHCPLMAGALTLVGHRQTRNRGTIGGSLCHLDPAAELPCVAAAMDATLEIASTRGTREIAFADFPAGYMTPALEPDELLTRVRLPLWPESHGAAFVEYARRHGDFAIVSAAALLTLDDAGRIARVSLALGGVGVAPLRMSDIETTLAGQKASAGALRDAAEACRTIEAADDVHAPASYRRHLATVMARRALERALERARPRRAAAA